MTWDFTGLKHEYRCNSCGYSIYTEPGKKPSVLCPACNPIILPGLMFGDDDTLPGYPVEPPDEELTEDEQAKKKLDKFFHDPKDPKNKWWPDE